MRHDAHPSDDLRGATAGSPTPSLAAGAQPRPDGPERPAAPDVPRATYRVQLHAGFRFDQAQAIVPYLQALGISHLYTSPYLKARAGSTHGYDIVDHASLNPEIGDEAAFDALCDTLAAHGLQQLVDVVPNHMGVLEADNPWWLDVLEHGPASEHADSFDIDWQHAASDAPSQLLLPVLGAPYGEVLEAGELRLVWDGEGLSFRVDYHEHRCPVDPRDTAVILRSAPLPEDAGDAARDECDALLRAFEALPLRDDPRPAQRAARRAGTAAARLLLRDFLARHGWALGWVDRCVAAHAGRPGDAASFDALDALIRRQAWRLAYWRVAGDEINYRRFFDVNTLAAVRMERPEVFERAHRRLLQWLGQGRVSGFRIDHPDGLADPAQYFRRLQAAAVQAQRAAGVAEPRELYLLIEKILAPHEHWPASWPVHGDTGYRFGALVNGLFVDGRHAEAFDRLLAQFVGRAVDYDAELLAAKRAVLQQALAADLHMLTERVYAVAQADRRTRDYTRNGLRLALAELAAGFPVYRSYLGSEVDDDAGRQQDRRHLDWALAAAKREGLAEATTLEWVHGLLLGADAETDPSRHETLRTVVRRFQQLTAPVMAKAAEDTAFYRYHRLVSLNEVGGEPRQFGLSVAAFHGANVARQRHLPYSMLGTSTHDSKRSEDVRARLDVLSELPQAWLGALERWSALNRPRAERAEGDAEIGRTDELLLYQTLVGVWPTEPIDDAGLATLRERVQAYLVKALREGKQSTSWMRPNEAYEAAVARFVDLALQRLEPNPFLSDLRAFVDGIAPFGAWNSLNQLLFKLTAPGVPDVYQGCETWNFSLVDPDNRRPVDHASLQRTLEGLQAAPADGDARAPAVAALREQWRDGRLKLDTTWRLLHWRREAEALFRDGRYLPLEARGPAEDHVVAYARHDAGTGDWALVVGTRLLYTLTGGRADEVCAHGDWHARWLRTAVVLPADAPRRWVDVFSGRVHELQPLAPTPGASGTAGTASTAGEGAAPVELPGLCLAPVFSELPYAALRPLPETGTSR